MGNSFVSLFIIFKIAISVSSIIINLFYSTIIFFDFKPHYTMS